MEDIYDWVPWFSDLAKKIADGGEEYLVERAKRVEWGRPIKQFRLFQHGDENIDPFSFIYTLAFRNTSNLREPVFRSVERVFDVLGLFPLDNPEAAIFPTPEGRANTLFHDGENGRPETLWRLLKGAVQGRGEVRKEDFDDALKITQVAEAKLTQTLFLINGREFLPYDKTMRALKIGRDIVDLKTFNFDSYMQKMEEIRDVFQGCDNAEINLFAYRQGKGKGKLNPNPNRCFVVSTNFDDWKDFASNNWICTGGPKAGTRGQESGSETNRYPLDEPTPGDILLVRTGDYGRGVGIVHENGYQEEISAEAKLHVIWINKSQQELSIGARRGAGFMKGDKKWDKAFRAAYPDTFDMLDRLAQGKPEQHKDQPSSVYPQEKALHPLNTILYGPPGTGKTFATFKRCVEICDGEAPNDDIEIRERYRELVEVGQVEFATFHQSYGYEEFVQGLRPVSSQDGPSIKVKKGLIRRIAKRARKSDQPHVLVIDEINRANISKVMGELITLIEADKRKGQDNEVRVRLPHSQKSFSLPSNLYILGTMNTADRSIALLDVALRRRFDFEEMLPEPDLLQDEKEKTGVDLPKVLNTINESLEYLIDRDHLIGHAWLMGIQSKDELDECMRQKIIPLIAEYFFEDWSKVHAVLGSGDGFLDKEKLESPKGLSDDQYRWRLREEFTSSAYDELIGQSQ